jgi:hypothetical protein
VKAGRYLEAVPLVVRIRDSSPRGVLKIRGICKLTPTKMFKYARRNLWQYEKKIKGMARKRLLFTLSLLSLAAFVYGAAYSEMFTHFADEALFIWLIASLPLIIQLIHNRIFPEIHNYDDD